MKHIIATVGPSLLHKVRLKDVHSDNLIYRINGAHGNIEVIEDYIKDIKNQVNNAKILMDLPGNKIRTANFEYGFIEIEKNKNFEIGFYQFNFKDFYKFIKTGDIVLANDSIFKFELKNIDIKNKKLIFLSHSSGKLQNNKGFHIKGVSKKLPFLFEKDLKLIELANKYNIDFVGLSFVRNLDDIKEAKKLIYNSKIIAKIETYSAVDNLDEILDNIDHILIDRGDLSTDVGIYQVPKYQQYIIDKALLKDKKIFLATQFLKSMEYNPIPTFPEVIDLHNTMQKGIFGIQLSEETAVGKYPKECIEVIKNIFYEINGK